MYRQQQFDTLLSSRRILIAGYGREGRSSHDFLRRCVPSAVADVACNDDEIFASLERARNSGQPYQLIIKSPGISTMKFEGRCDLDTITSQTDLFLQVYGDKTVAVTGTKGKSTTATLIHHVLQDSLPGRKVILAGNMGIPLLDIVDDIDEDTVIVAELSCHQLENIRRAPHVGVVLNLYQEHLDHYHDYLGYQMAKMQMMLRQQPEDVCFYCTDSDDLRQLVAKIAPQCRSSLRPYSLADAQKSNIASILPPTLPGSHNASNVCVAELVSAVCGVSHEQFAASLATFHGLPHRLELVGTYDGITFYNDSISTIPEAAIAAVEALQQVDTLILGGFDRGIDYSPLISYLAAPDSLGAAIRNLVFVGQAGRRILSEGHIAGRNILVEDDYARIVPWCFAHTQQGRICLLSPAAASYDAFKNFEHRGQTYKELIYNEAKEPSKLPSFKSTD